MAAPTARHVYWMEGSRSRDSRLPAADYLQLRFLHEVLIALAFLPTVSARGHSTPRPFDKEHSGFPVRPKKTLYAVMSRLRHATPVPGSCLSPEGTKSVFFRGAFPVQSDSTAAMIVRR